MSNQHIHTRDLIAKAIDLQHKLENIYRAQGIRLAPDAMLDLLEAIAKELSDESVNKKKIEDHASGIFRIVTDGWVLENSELGRELMNFRSELHKYANTLPESE